MVHIFNLVSKIVLTYFEKKCSSDREKTFEIYSDSKRSEFFLKQNAFLSGSWRFLRLEHLEFKLEKIIGV